MSIASIIGGCASNSPVPSWVPVGARNYLLHVEAGLSIRDIARDAGCHASTILRQVRRIETRRDDPLTDAALASLARGLLLPRRRSAGPTGADTCTKELSAMNFPLHQQGEQSETALLNREAVRVLRRLCENGAVLAVAENMEKAVVVRDDDSGSSLRTAVVDAPIAQALALKEWIACPNPGRISRYRITSAGRAALSRLLAEQESRLRNSNERGFAESQATFGDPGGDWSGDEDESGEPTRKRRVRYSVAESPLVALARRRDKDGKPFLDDSMVEAGERLREDFELSQMGPRVSQNWDRMLTGGGRGGPNGGTPADNAPARARERVARALSDLGPGLGDVVLRCCCHLEGLEIAEKRMGWSARSGKIVLRIALQRLERHYQEQSDSDRMIG